VRKLQQGTLFQNLQQGMRWCLQQIKLYMQLSSAALIWTNKIAAIALKSPSQIFHGVVEVWMEEEFFDPVVI
jgi:hypothetical protein